MDFTICTLPPWLLCCMTMTVWHVGIWMWSRWAGCFERVRFCRTQDWAANILSKWPYSLMGGACRESKQLSACTSMMTLQLACGENSLTELPDLRTSHALKKKLDSICWFFCTLTSCTHIQLSALRQSLIMISDKMLLVWAVGLVQGYTAPGFAGALTE